MARTLTTYGLALVLALLLLGACGEPPAEPPPTDVPAPPDEVPPDEAPPPDDPVTRPCTWPEWCEPQTAREMLEEIGRRADLEAPGQTIDPDDLRIIHERIQICSQPGLTNSNNKPVCELADPEACTELKEILDLTDPQKIPTNPPARIGHWHTIATELTSFPSGH